MFRFYFCKEQNFESIQYENECIIHNKLTNGVNEMETFNKISIENISKHDLLVILEALKYSYEHSKEEEFITLRNTMVQDLISLSDLKSEEHLIEYLQE